jgi:hypothetical protein
LHIALLLLLHKVAGAAAVFPTIVRAVAILAVLPLNDKTPSPSTISTPTTELQASQTVVPIGIRSSNGNGCSLVGILMCH